MPAVSMVHSRHHQTSPPSPTLQLSPALPNCGLARGTLRGAFRLSLCGQQRTETNHQARGRERRRREEREGRGRALFA